MSSEPFAIEFRHVSISFEGKRALDDISFQLKRGQMICITGTSGSGLRAHGKHWGILLNRLAEKCPGDAT